MKNKIINIVTGTVISLFLVLPSIGYSQTYFTNTFVKYLNNQVSPSVDTWSISASSFNATSTTASFFPYASTTAISSTGSGYFATSGGKIGIGTTTPYSILDIFGTSAYLSGSELNTEINDKANQGALYFSSSASNAEIVHTINQTIGTDPFTIWTRIKIPLNNTSTNGIFWIGGNSTGDGNGSIGFDFSGGNLRLVIKTPNTNTQNLINGFTNSISASTPGYGDQIIDLAFVRSGTTLTPYINGIAQTATTSNLIDDSITSTYAGIGTRNNSGGFGDRMLKFVLFNRALSVDDIRLLRSRGVGFMDQWGNMTNQTSGTLTTGKNYRIENYVAGDDFTNIGASSNATGVEFTTTGTTPTTWTNGSALIPIGAMLHSDLENADPSVSTIVRDKSSNSFDGVSQSTTLVAQVKPVRQINSTHAVFTNSTSTNSFSTTLVTSGNTYLATNSGSVGIGTTSALTKLTLSTNTAGGGISIDTTGSNSVAYSLYNSAIVKAYLGLSLTNNGLITGSIANDVVFRSQGGNILFSTDSGNTAQMYLKNGGGVGIGTTTPASKLHVSAGTSATTTVEFGAQDITSKTCFNVRNNTGAATSFYFVGTTMVIESNRCR